MTTGIKGVDTISHALSGAILAAHDYKFACRYYAGHTSRIGKEITASEVVEKSAAGVRIVSNWETDGRPDNTIARGEAHARGFLAQHAEVGGPPGKPCYFSIDHDADPDSLDLYFTGARNVLGVRRSGVYGGGALIRHLKAKGLVTYGWLAMSTGWQGSGDHAGCDIVQIGRGSVAGYEVDYDIALTADYGGWLLNEQGDDLVTPAEFLALLKDPDVAAYMRAVAWQYDGRGIPADMTALGVLNATLAGVTTLADRVDALTADVEALAATSAGPTVSGDVAVSGTLHLAAPSA